MSGKTTTRYPTKQYHDLAKPEGKREINIIIGDRSLNHTSPYANLYSYC